MFFGENPVTTEGVLFLIVEVGRVSTPPGAVWERRHGGRNPAEQGGGKLTVVNPGGQELGKEGVACAGEAGAGPSDVYDTGVQGATMLARVVIVMTRRGSQDAVPCGSLLDKTQQAEVIGWSSFARRVGYHLVDSEEARR